MAVLVLKYYLSADAQKLTGGKLKMRGDMAMKLRDAERDDRLTGFLLSN